MNVLGSADIIRANALALPLSNSSVDLVISSPPYFALRSYQDDGAHYEDQIGSEPTPQAFLEALWAVMAECWRVLKPSGSCWINLGDRYALPGHFNANNKAMGVRAAEASAALKAHVRRPTVSWGGIRNKSLMGLPWRFANGCIDGKAAPCGKAHEHHGRSSALLPSERCEGARWILRAEVVWHKHGLPEPTATDRPHRKHEQWFMLTKAPRYFSALTDPPGSVWSVASERLDVPSEVEVAHHAAFPTEFPRQIILGWSPGGGTVLDPFGGTGTTAMVAKALGRHGISVDLSADYNRLATWRTNDPQQLRNVQAKTYGIKREAPVLSDGQGSMFDDA